MRPGLLLPILRSRHLADMLTLLLRHPDAEYALSEVQLAMMQHEATLLSARCKSVPGAVPNDIDVLVVGEVPRRDIYQAAERAEQWLGLPVNPVLSSQERWLAAADPLVQQVKTAPIVWVTGAQADGASGLTGRAAGSNLQCQRHCHLA
jgi:hypothetical protein